MILQFLQDKTKVPPDTFPLVMDDFSEIQDPHIQIQEGPLGCYCSHLKAMMYGFLSGTDMTFIVEDDISILNTETIQRYLPQIPADWDMIFLGASPHHPSRYHGLSYYRLVEGFHCSHSYLIRKQCFPTLFAGMYPITDQVDVLISNLVHDLRIYNIPETVFQKSVVTSVQNNLHTIYHAPNYHGLRTRLSCIETRLVEYANRFLPENEKENRVLVKHIMSDFILSTLHHEPHQVSMVTVREEVVSSWEVEDPSLLKSMTHFLRMTRRGRDSELNATWILQKIFTLLSRGFPLHHQLCQGGILKAHRYGASSRVYRQSQNILKVYHPELFWKGPNHQHPTEIFDREVRLLTRVQGLPHVPQLLEVDHQHHTLLMVDGGTSLYDDFVLPSDWRQQIEEFFHVMTQQNMVYPEFNLKNILVREGYMTMIDFGLASDHPNPVSNLHLFLRHLEILHEKFTTVPDPDERNRLYQTWRSLHLSA